MSVMSACCNKEGWRARFSFTKGKWPRPRRIKGDQDFLIVGPAIKEAKATTGVKYAKIAMTDSRIEDGT